MYFFCTLMANYLVSETCSHGTSGYPRKVLDPEGLEVKYSKAETYVSTSAKSKSPSSFAIIAKEGWGTPTGRSNLVDIGSLCWLDLDFE